MAEDEATTYTEEVPQRKVRPRLAAMVDTVLTQIYFLFSRVGKDTRLLARHLEHTVFPEEIKRREEEEAHPGYFYHRRKVLRLDVDGEHIGSFEALSDFLSSLGIRTVVCDLDLHYDQIQWVIQEFVPRRKFLPIFWLHICPMVPAGYAALSPMHLNLCKTKMS